MVLNVPEIPPKLTEIVTLSGEQGGLGKTTLSLSTDVTIRLGRGVGVKGKSDDVTLYDGIRCCMICSDIPLVP